MVIVSPSRRRQSALAKRLDADDNQVRVTVQDNGKGMPPEIIKKIMQNLAVTEGKIDGHGIGLTQVRETLAQSHGTLSIDSTVWEGTQITAAFPRIKAPTWIAEEIKLGAQDIVVILDDDCSIHLAWDARFQVILKQAPDIKVYHFEGHQETLDFISGLTEPEKKRVFLLTVFSIMSRINVMVYT